MYRQKAAISTIDDVLKTIGRREDYDIDISDDGTLKVDAYPFVLKMKEQSPVYHWTVEAEDDPSDRDEGYSTSPTEDIVDFVKGDIPGGSFLDKYASVLLESLAEAVEFGRCSPSIASRVLRRIATAMRVAEVSQMDLLTSGTETGSYLLALHKRQMDALALEMQKKDWKIEQFEDDSSLPAIKFDIGDRYSGKIMLHDMMYEYEFSVHGSPNVTQSGVVNDLFETLNEWVKSEKVIKARESAPGVEEDAKKDIKQSMERSSETETERPQGRK